MAVFIPGASPPDVSTATVRRFGMVLNVILPTFLGW